jgi:hypothetical protein
MNRPSIIALAIAARAFASHARAADRHNPPHVATGKDVMATCLGAAAGAGASWLVLPRRDGVAVGYRFSFN